MTEQHTLEYLQRTLDECLDTLENNDLELFGVDGSEWAIAHRLAVYLEPLFPGWNIDCEYNRQGEDTNEKRGTDGRLRRPDIIIHRRKLLPRADNLLIIELKKENSLQDLEKACDFTTPPQGKRRFQYQFGLAVSFDPQRELAWFSNGIKQV